MADENLRKQAADKILTQIIETVGKAQSPYVRDLAEAYALVVGSLTNTVTVSK